MNMAKTVLIFSLAFFIVNTSLANAQNKDPSPILAVFLLENRGSPLTPNEIQALTDYLSTKLGEGGDFKIIPREEIRKRLKEQQKESYKACYDQSCQIDVGRELAAQMTLTSNVSRVGSSCIITTGLFDLAKGATINTATARARCDADELIAAIEEVAAKLKGQEVKPIVQQVQTPPPVTQPVQQVQPMQMMPMRQPRTKSTFVACLLSFFPGGGMYYLERWGWGTFYLLSWSASLGLMVGGLADRDTSSDPPAYTWVGVAGYAGFYIANLIHTYIAASGWKDPDFDYSQQPGYQFRPVNTAPMGFQHNPAIVFPVFQDRF
jgi:hypothetical protein